MLILDFIQGLVVVEEGMEGGYGNDFQREELKFLEDSQSDNQN
jgi:hypothetical protein